MRTFKLSALALALVGFILAGCEQSGTPGQTGAGGTKSPSTTGGATGAASPAAPAGGGAAAPAAPAQSPK
jgi:hypothetical protein